MKLNVEGLTLEITRQCNMACPHCMRGTSQDVSMSVEVIYSLFSRIGSVRTLTFTGGEPSLHTGLMLAALNAAKDNEVIVESVFIATNGKRVSDEFVEACIKWNEYCASSVIPANGMLAPGQCNRIIEEIRNPDEPYGKCVVALSMDEWHEDIPTKNLAKLLCLPHLSCEKHVDDDEGDRYILRTGRALRNGIGQNDPYVTRAFAYRDNTRTFEFEEKEDDRISTETLYVNAHGQLLGYCDYAYDDQETYAFGRIEPRPVPGRVLPVDDTWLDRLVGHDGKES